MSDKTYLTLEQILRRLNPNLILESPEFKEEKRHRVKTWQEILPWKYLQRDASLNSDIYNNGRFEINIDPKNTKRSFYTILYEPAANKFTKKHRQ